MCNKARCGDTISLERHVNIYASRVFRQHVTCWHVLCQDTKTVQLHLEDLRVEQFGFCVCAAVFTLWRTFKTHTLDKWCVFNFHICKTGMPWDLYTLGRYMALRAST